MFSQRFSDGFYESLQLTEMNYQKVTGDLHEKFRDSESYLLIANFRLSLRSLLFFVGRLSAVILWIVWLNTFIVHLTDYTAYFDASTLKPW